ncbi:hypothetical protein ACHAQH_005296 [Verticillium albo-atrum]
MYKSDGAVTPTSVLRSLPQWLTKRHVLVALALTSTIVLLFSFNSWGPDVHLPHVTTGSANSQASSSGNAGSLLPQCAGRDKVASLDLWDESQSKYQGLMDDKFTIAIQTYQRPDELNQTLRLLTDMEIPSLHEIVIVWNDLDATPPPNFVSSHGVSVRYRVSRRNSLNEKLWPDPEYKTKAILLSDDDVHYPPEDLDFVFQTWRKYGRHRLTGAFARCVDTPRGPGSYQYSLCREKNRSEYALVLTGLAFAHIEVLDYFSSTDPLMTRLRTFVDERFNCEDIALNFVASMLSCEGPLQVNGLGNAVNTEPKTGISRKPGHGKARNDCLHDFSDWFGYMPLQNTTERIVRGIFAT